MIIKRETLLRELLSVLPGVVKQEQTEQSHCFGFKDGNVITFNGDIACRRKCSLDNITGAVLAHPLIDLLSKLDGDDVDVTLNEETGHLAVKCGKRRKSGIRMESDFTMPVDEIAPPKKWRKLHKEFTEAVRLAVPCAGKDENQFILTCVHIAPDRVEACNNVQIIRYPLETGLKDPILIRAKAAKHLSGQEVSLHSTTNTWIHFRNEEGLIISCRRVLATYPSMKAYLGKIKGQKTELSSAIGPAVTKAEIFSRDREENEVTISLVPGKITIEGRAASGYYMESWRTGYGGKPIRFMIPPKILIDITAKFNKCRIDKKRLFIQADKFVYMTCLGKA